jgi:hypothetical protein
LHFFEKVFFIATIEIIDIKKRATAVVMVDRFGF